MSEINNIKDKINLLVNALLNIHGDINVNFTEVFDKFSKTKRKTDFEL